MTKTKSKESVKILSYEDMQRLVEAQRRKLADLQNQLNQIQNPVLNKADAVYRYLTDGNIKAAVNIIPTIEGFAGNVVELKAVMKIERSKLQSLEKDLKKLNPALHYCEDCQTFHSKRANSNQPYADIEDYDEDF